MTHVIVGSIVIEPGRVHRESYEVAAWWTDVALEPGTYEAHAYDQPSGGDVRLYAKVPGVVTAAYTPSLFGGVPVGSQPQGETHHDVGRSRDVHLTLGADDVTFAPGAGEHIAWWWVTAPSAAEFNGRGLAVRRHRTLRFIARMARCDFRLDPDDGGLPEFVDESSTLAERINELQAAGLDPDVWRVTYTDDGRPWFETPFEDHRPNNARKYPYDYSNNRAHWRYYLPDFDPRKVVAR